MKCHFSFLLKHHFLLLVYFLHIQVLLSGTTYSPHAFIFDFKNSDHFTHPPTQSPLSLYIDIYKVFFFLSLYTFLSFKT
ncbi:hypothetical protein QVD17_26124 [Tagetes erecta]|uniref:Uncharacterized protein n=1 Tax=Tagetes erecta TaxID=13708 RepID=A0AAD8NQ16_TARER|nr:hypothetical protein QVD17_26124 [Tagetes erecta]